MSCLTALCKLTRTVSHTHTTSAAHRGDPHKICLIHTATLLPVHPMSNLHVGGPRKVRLRTHCRFIAQALNIHRVTPPTVRSAQYHASSKATAAASMSPEKLSARLLKAARFSQAHGSSQLRAFGHVLHDAADQPGLDPLPQLRGHQRRQDQVQAFEHGHAPGQLLHAVEQLAQPVVPAEALQQVRDVVPCPQRPTLTTCPTNTCGLKPSTTPL